MNIEVKQISNGWLVVVHLKQGSSALYCKDFDDVLINLGELKKQIDAQSTPPGRQ